MRKHFTLLCAMALTVAAPTLVACSDDDDHSDSIKAVVYPTADPADGQSGEKLVAVKGDHTDFGTLAEGNVVATGSYMNLAMDAATLLCTVDIDNVAETDVYGVYVHTTQKEIVTDGTFLPATATSDNHFEVDIDGLAPGTVYYYCAAIPDADATKARFGEVKSLKTYNFDVVTSGEANLGLSVKWAAANLGATLPQETGDYYAWGEIVTKDEYTTSNAQWHGKDVAALVDLKVLDRKMRLTADYDVVAQKMTGWHTPTMAQMHELFAKCEWTWLRYNGAYGCMVTGPNGKSIFMPATGYFSGKAVEDKGAFGAYWSATPFDFDNNARRIFFNNSYVYSNGDKRYIGCPIRPVTE